MKQVCSYILSISLLLTTGIHAVGSRPPVNIYSSNTTNNSKTASATASSSSNTQQSGNENTTNTGSEQQQSTVNNNTANTDVSGDNEANAVSSDNNQKQSVGTQDSNQQTNNDDNSDDARNASYLASVAALGTQGKEQLQNAYTNAYTFVADHPYDIVFAMVGVGAVADLAYNVYQYWYNQLDEEPTVYKKAEMVCASAAVVTSLYCIGTYYCDASPIQDAYASTVNYINSFGSGGASQ